MMARSNPKRRTQKEDKAKERLVTVLNPNSGASEAYRALRTNLIYSLVDAPLKTIVLTSPGPKEGKSITCANLGVALAQVDKRTLIIDCDLRRPTIHKFFALHNFQGVVDVLSGERGLQEVWWEPMPGLKVLASGPTPPNPAELLGSRRFAEFLDQVRQEFDYVLIDTPPLGVVSDAAILAAQGDKVLLVLDAQNTRKGSVRQAMNNLKTVGAEVIGTIMNNVDASRGGRYSSSYTYE